MQHCTKPHCAHHRHKKVRYDLFMHRIAFCVALGGARLLGLDLQHAAVKFSAADQKAAAVLIEEVEKRSQIRWPGNTAGSPVIALERAQGPAEGYAIRS